MKYQDIIGRSGALLLYLCLASCSSGPGSSPEMAAQLAETYYQALKNKDFDKAASLFMDTRAEPRAMWLDELKDYHEQLGDLQDYQLVGQIVNTVYSGTRYTLRYKTHYAKSEAHETVILFDGVSTFNGGENNGLQIESLIIRAKNG